MSQATVDHIIEEIQKLSDEDRMVLDRRLAELDEAQWQAEAAQARRIAAEDGIDEAEIQRRIDELRYG